MVTVRGPSGVLRQPPERPDLPPHPAWNPTYLDLGEPGRHGSTGLLCNEDTGVVEGNQVWADDSGVYAWVRIFNDPLTAGPLASRPSGGALHFNDGTGWDELFWAPWDAGGGVELVAYESGTVLIGGFFCGIGAWDGTNVSCSYPSVPTDLFVAGATVEALVGDELITLMDDSWGAPRELPDLGASATPQSLWSDGARATVAGTNQYLVQVEDGGVVDLSIDVPAGHYGAVWIAEDGDIWLGNQVGELVHFDGMTWTTVPTGLDEECSQFILELWGHEDVIYFITSLAFGRWDGDSVEILAEVDCTSESGEFTDLWGSPDGSEVFLTVTDYEYVDYECGSTFVVYYDGTEFHAF